ncbi:MAG: biotin carboxylase, partial [Balneolaceae bacterium]|nr:biotin carboxylase [Balneolaceae bacterium]
FGDDRVYVEKYLVEPRHVEFQIIADTHGNVLHLYDRECSVQRRHQKVIEEAPCTILTPELRAEMAEAAVSAARACDYIGAGTVEFLVDRDRNYYFLEMNTRLQVEHPVTELITGVDLVRLQILVAEGRELPFAQKEVEIRGHAIECRIYAEDPRDNFLPSTGILTKHRIPAGNGIRVDAGIEEGQQVTINYDPMISKLCSHGRNRDEAIHRMLRALEEYEIAGCRTTIPFCRFVLCHESFADGEYNTHFVQDHFEIEKPGEQEREAGVVPFVAAALLRLNNGRGNRSAVRFTGESPAAPSRWWRNRREP